MTYLFELQAHLLNQLRCLRVPAVQQFPVGQSDALKLQVCVVRVDLRFPMD